MFESRKQLYAVASPQIETDDYNYDSITYEEQEEPARIYLVVQDRTLMYNNDLHLYNATLVGYTDDERLDINWLIDGKYIVVSTLPHRREKVLYLKEFSDGK